jgi:hypothetical protein
MQLEPTEGPFESEVFAAVWNARPAIAADLVLNLGTLSTKAIEAVRDVYWSTLTGRPLASDRRLGRFQFVRRNRIIRFQERELARWQPLSARVWHSAAELSVGPVQEEVMRSPDSMWSVLAPNVGSRIHHEPGGRKDLWDASVHYDPGLLELAVLREVRQVWEDILPAERPSGSGPQIVWAGLGSESPVILPQVYGFTDVEHIELSGVYLAGGLTFLVSADQDVLASAANSQLANAA